MFRLPRLHQIVGYPKFLRYYWPTSQNSFNMRFLQATIIAFAAFIASSAALKGIVKSWDSEKGIGYITPDDGSPDVYFYRSEVDVS